MKTDPARIKKLSRAALALFVGTLVWGAAIDSESFSVKQGVPLIIEVAEGYIVMGSNSDSAFVTLTGSGLSMLTSQISSPLSEIVKSVQIPGDQSFPATVSVGLRQSDVDPQGSVVVTEVTPFQVSLTVDTLVSRRLPVALISSDEIPSRFRFVRVEPDHITVTGPSSVVLQMDSVVTEAVSIGSGLTSASLAFSGDMVAYSEGFVEIRIYEPIVPDGRL
ncbi:MAG: hypothetical protein KAH54_01060 [Candidatus Sabulitectum sp.]|nr:hypothetical protein [Candidatus Sabulitectum sp.]